MRQAIFVVVLVAAAFLGGAMVNGPGIRWVQSRLLDYMGLKDGGEIASIDLPPTSSSNADTRPLAGAPTVNEPSSRNVGAGTESAAKISDNRKSDSSPGLKGSTQASSDSGPSSTRASRAEGQNSSPPLSIPTSVPEPAAPHPSDLKIVPTWFDVPAQAPAVTLHLHRGRRVNQRRGEAPVPPRQFHPRASRLKPYEPISRLAWALRGQNRQGHLQLPWIRAWALHCLPLCLPPHRRQRPGQTGQRQTLSRWRWHPNPLRQAYRCPHPPPRRVQCQERQQVRGNLERNGPMFVESCSRSGSRGTRSRVK